MSLAHARDWAALLAGDLGTFALGLTGVWVREWYKVCW